MRYTVFVVTPMCQMHCWFRQRLMGDNSCAEGSAEEEQLLRRIGLSWHVFNSVSVTSNCQIHCWYKKRLRETSLVQEGLSRDMFYKALLYFCVKDIGTERGWKRQLLFTREGGGGGRGGGGRMMRSKRCGGRGEDDEEQCPPPCPPPTATQHATPLQYSILPSRSPLSQSQTELFE